MKSIQFISVLCCCLIIISGELYSQDILYKKDSTTVKVNVTDFNGKTVTYQIPGDSLKRTRYISKSVLDSLKYLNGRSLSFQFQNMDLIPRLIKRNFIGVDIVNFTKGNPNIWYEWISAKGKTSLSVEFLFNSDPQQLDGLSGDPGILQSFTFKPYNFFTKLGINFYPFNYSLARAGDFRFSTGPSVLLGSCRRKNWRIYPNVYDSFFAPSLMWKVDASVYIGSMLQIQGGLDISLLPFLTFFCPEVCLAIGF